jgi:hypothetical protein
MTFERQIATASRLIAQYGADCVWREPGTPTGSPARPVAGTPSDAAVKILFLTNTSRESLASLLSMIADTELPSGGKRGLMAGNISFTPSLSGLVAVGNVFAEPALRILPKNGIDLLAPNQVEPILYYLRFAG